MGTHYFPALRILIFTVTVFGMPCLAAAGEYRGSPIRLFFYQSVKAAVLSVTNASSDSIQLQIRSYQWTQDAEGKDRYQETQDIIFFPKILELKKGEKRVVRVGLKQPRTGGEKTYRLFIEEMRKPRKSPGGAGVDISIRFGVPIFVAPLQASHKGMIDHVTFGEGKLSFQVHNPGNSHLMIESLTVKGIGSDGSESFSKELSGWYLLAGATRTYETPLSQEICRDTAKVNVEAKSEQLTFSEKVDAISTLCLP